MWKPWPIPYVDVSSDAKMRLSRVLVFSELCIGGARGNASVESGMVCMVYLLAKVEGITVIIKEALGIMIGTTIQIWEQ